MEPVSEAIPNLCTKQELHAAVQAEREALALILEEKAAGCEHFGWPAQAAGLRQLAQEIRERQP